MCIRDSANAEWIGQVQVGTFSRSSGASTYSDFTAQVIDLQRGANSLRLTPQFSGRAYPEYWKAWIDLNKDGDFLDAGEEVYSSGRALSTVASGNLTVPANAPAGKTRLRIAMRYNAAPVPCGSFNYGEVEDYSVRLQ